MITLLRWIVGLLFLGVLVLLRGCGGLPAPAGTRADAARNRRLRVFGRLRA